MVDNSVDLPVWNQWSGDFQKVGFTGLRLYCYPVLQNIGLFLNTFLNLGKLFTIHFGQKDCNILIFGRTNLANFVSKIKQILTSVLFKKF